MKYHKFNEKLPEIGSNIILISKKSQMLGIIEFTLRIRKAILSKCDCEYSPTDYFSDDTSEDSEYDIKCADYWCYPSSIIEMINDEK
jgi:hypothetical protein